MAGYPRLLATALSTTGGWQFGLGFVFWVLATATPAQVYKWTDAAGQVHYGDHPPAQVSAEPLEIVPPPADSTAAGLRPGERQLLQAITTEERRLARERQAQSRREARYRQAEAAQRRTRCENYRRRLQHIEDKLVTGYKVREADRLHEQRDDYRMKIKEYCD
ncbi:MAG: DUF4124 domain-containing protein [Candidatus Competibacteraceae bacterium]